MRASFSIQSFTLLLCLFTLQMYFCEAVVLETATGPYYQARCFFKQLDFYEECLVAQFSAMKNYSMQVSFSPNLLRNPENFCSLDIRLLASTSKSSLAIANRGSCNFDQKEEVAAQLGYDAIILVNSDDTLFVVGASDADKSYSIPMFIVRRSFVKRLLEGLLVQNESSDTLDVHLSFGSIFNLHNSNI